MTPIDNVVRLSPKVEHDLICTTCGAHGVGSCGHNTYVSAGKAAEKAVAEHPEMSDRAIAEKLGVGVMTVSRARAAGVPNGTTETRVGRDGKKYKARKPRGDAAKYAKAREVVRPRVEADQALQTGALEQEHGISKDTFERAALAEQARKEAFEELLGATAAQNYTEKGKLKIEDSIRILKAYWAKHYQPMIDAGIRKGIADAADFNRVRNVELVNENLRLGQMLNQRGVFTEQQYNKLMMCVHPDNSASEAVRREMQALLNDKSIRRRLIKS